MPEPTNTVRGPGQEVIEPIKTISSQDGRSRVHFWRRDDALFQFFEQHLHDDEEQGQSYSMWRVGYPASGLFPDLLAAESEARRSLAWLKRENSN